MRMGDLKFVSTSKCAHCMYHAKWSQTPPEFAQAPPGASPSGAQAQDTKAPGAEPARKPTPSGAEYRDSWERKHGKLSHISAVLARPTPPGKNPRRPPVGFKQRVCQMLDINQPKPRWTKYGLTYD